MLFLFKGEELTKALFHKAGWTNAGLICPINATQSFLLQKTA